MWIVIIVIVIIIILCNSNRKEKNTAPSSKEAEDIRLAKLSAEKQVKKIRDAISAGDYKTHALECDDTIKYVEYRKTIAGAYAYLRIIENESLCYEGNLYPNRRGNLLEDLVREKIESLPMNHYIG